MKGTRKGNAPTMIRKAVSLPLRVPSRLLIALSGEGILVHPYTVAARQEYAHCHPPADASPIVAAEYVATQSPYCSAYGQTSPCHPHRDSEYWRGVPAIRESTSTNASHDSDPRSVAS